MTAVTSLRVPVLMYHEVAGSSALHGKMAVAPEVFADQLGYLRDAGFTAVTAGTLAATLADGTGELPERPVVLTFDDGYGDYYTQAMPLLKQHDMVGTMFMTTEWVGLGDSERRMLTWRELAELAECGTEVAGHTCKHPQLDQLPEQELREELHGCRSLLEDKLGFAVTGLAYPFGYSSALVRRVAREVGYSYAYAVGNAMTTGKSDLFALPRLTVKRSTTMDSFIKMVNGQDTFPLQRDRVLTTGYSVVRRAKASVRAARTSAASSAR
jgi:peptidoglycan/xylan/chitin deacetylase (PgdA/CDA1 family)